MICRNCGANLNAGATVCDICGRRIEESDIPKVDNPATTSFNINKVEKKKTEPANTDTTLSEYKYEPKPDNRDNKKYNQINKNDRIKATIINFIELIIILVVFAVVLYLIYHFVFES